MLCCSTMIYYVSASSFRFVQYHFFFDSVNFIDFMLWCGKVIGTLLWHSFASLLDPFLVIICIPLFPQTGVTNFAGFTGDPPVFCVDVIHHNIPVSSKMNIGTIQNRTIAQTFGVDSHRTRLVLDGLLPHQCSSTATSRSSS